ncbi:MAG: HpcH/HpaI aldolase/citrate lyase family protein [Lachnospiraceae bacterium]|jgi:citrate lyase beta subunit
MRHHRYNPDFKFVHEPVEFNKYTDRDFLPYCLGASMYMPGIKDFKDKILNREMPALTTMVMCFEDACPGDKVEEAELNVRSLLETVYDAVEAGILSENDVPLIFCRVRNINQFHHFSSMLEKKHVKILAGFNFPKFNSENGEVYFYHLKELNDKFQEPLYGMPIIEDSKVAYKETRLEELIRIRAICDKYKEIILQIRVGATDFSACFGVRRGVDYSIYDIMTVRECLTDILNIFSRENDYVISGPVWEYFRASKEMMFKELPRHSVEDILMQRIPIYNVEIDGLLREIVLDKANGFVGRTVIHPTHVKFVNALQAVTKEEYEDACQVLETGDGVIKSAKANKMNEIKPHTNWAKKIYMRALAYGVIENEKSFLSLFAVDD